MDTEIKSKEFQTISQLNKFISTEKVEVISINNKKTTIYTGLPTLKGGDFSYEDYVYELIYKQKKSE